MNQDEIRIYLIKELLKEYLRYQNMTIPTTVEEQKKLLRGLINIRSPKEATNDFLKIQDLYLQETLIEKGITKLDSLYPITDSIYLWQGDITTLQVDAIVNAANSGMTGCYVPNHSCIDNCIHTFSGVQLRNDCASIMKQQGHEEPTGQAKITQAYNLPCKYILHTVGPIIKNQVRKKDEELLALCYRSCLELAAQFKLESIAFCCISTGEFHFPNLKAAEIATSTVKEFIKKETSIKKVVFNVFKDNDKEIYKQLLG